MTATPIHNSPGQTSRDASLYSLQVVNGSTIALQFGPLAGGSPTTFATTTSGSTANLLVAGWTTM